MKHKVLYTASLIVAGLCSALVLVSIGVFVAKFSSPDFELMNDPARWGQFGDYMGGTLNPLLAIINICIFIILTLTIQRLTDQNNEKSLETSRKIAFMSMKHEELKHFKEVMDRNLNEWANYPFEERFLIFEKEYHDIINRMQFVFPNLAYSSTNIALRGQISQARMHYFSREKREVILNDINRINEYYSLLVVYLSKWTVS